MSDKPILFSAPMIRALLEGRKTQTRRVLKPQPNSVDEAGRWYMMPSGGLSLDCIDLPIAVGDRLWVKEAWKTDAAYDDLSPSDMGGDEPVRYEADGSHQSWGYPVILRIGRYRHSRFMPRWASRITLTVTDVRVHRLQEISEADAISEGIKRRFSRSARFEPMTVFGVGDDEFHAPTAVSAYRDLWDSINGKKHPWESNPWVAGYTFSFDLRNIDAGAA